MKNNYNEKLILKQKNTVRKELNNENEFIFLNRNRLVCTGDAPELLTMLSAIIIGLKDKVDVDLLKIAFDLGISDDVNEFIKDDLISRLKDLINDLEKEGK